MWRVKLVAELRPGVLTETEVARIERDEQAGLADLGLRLADTKRLTAALQAEIVPAQVAAVGGQRRCCSSCGRRLGVTVPLAEWRVHATSALVYKAAGNTARTRRHNRLGEAVRNRLAEGLPEGHPLRQQFKRRSASLFAV